MKHSTRSFKYTLQTKHWSCQWQTIFNNSGNTAQAKPNTVKNSTSWKYSSAQFLVSFHPFSQQHLFNGPSYILLGSEEYIRQTFQQRCCKNCFIWVWCSSLPWWREDTSLLLFHLLIHQKKAFTKWFGLQELQDLCTKTLEGFLMCASSLLVILYAILRWQKEGPAWVNEPTFISSPNALPLDSVGICSILVTYALHPFIHIFFQNHGHPTGPSHQRMLSKKESSVLKALLCTHQIKSKNQRLSKSL